MDKTTIILSAQDEVFRHLFPWEISPNGYVRYRINKRGTIITLSLHRFIYGLMTGRGYYQDVTYDIDHINKNKLDNSRENLRLATRAQNNFNGVKKGISSQYKGVHFSKTSGKWIANITVHYKNVYLGIWESEEDAGYAYDTAVEVASDGQCSKNEIKLDEKHASNIRAYVLEKLQPALDRRNKLQAIRIAKLNAV